MKDLEAFTFDLPTDNVFDYIIKLVELVKQFSQPIVKRSSALQSTINDMMQEILTAKYKIKQFKQ